MGASSLSSSGSGEYCELRIMLAKGRWDLTWRLKG
jgi:hypothetical protein